MKRSYLALLAAGSIALAGCETTETSSTTAPALTPTAQAGTTSATSTAPGFAASGSAIDGTGAVTPEMMEALRQLSAEDYQTRQDAAQKLQLAMTRHFQQMVLVQQLLLKIQDNLAQQLQQMTLTPDAQGQARVASLMEFNQALSRWAIDVLALPAAQRDDMLKWGLSADGYPLVVRAYSRKDEVRATAAKDLAKVDNPPAIWLLGQLLNDTDREVSLNTMDALWDKKPTTQMVDVLWVKSVGQALQQIHPQQGRQRTVNVHGHIVQIYEQDTNAQARMQDADVAADVLIHWKDPVIAERLNALFKEIAGTINNPNDYRWRIISPNYGDAGRTLSRLVEAYKPKEAYTFITRVLGSTMQDGYVNSFGNNVFYWQSTRVDAAALLCRITGQDPDDYKMVKMPNYNPERWGLKVTKQDQPQALKEEQAMVRGVLVWWNQHYKEYGVDEAPHVPRAEDATGDAGVGPVPPAGAAGAAAARLRMQQAVRAAAPAAVQVDVTATDAAKAAADKRAKEAALEAAAKKAATTAPASAPAATRAATQPSK